MVHEIPFPLNFLETGLRELGAVPEMIERLRIGERFDILNRPAVNDVAHRELDDLVRFGSRNVGYLQHFRRYVARCGVLADACLDLRDQSLVEREALAELDEKHDPHVADLSGRPGLAYHQGFDHLFELLDLAVDLRCTDTHASRIEHRVGPAVDDHAVVRGYLAPVAVSPDAWKFFEVCGAIFRSVGIVPETYRKGRKRPSADEFAFSPYHGASILVVHLDLEAESAALDLAPPNGQDRIAEDEAPADIGSSGDRGQADVLLDRSVYVVESLRRERRAGRQHRTQVLESMRLRRLDPRLRSGVDELR